jgi:hypothetical protein
LRRYGVPLTAADCDAQVQCRDPERPSPASERLPHRLDVDLANWIASLTYFDLVWLKRVDPAVVQALPSLPSFSDAGKVLCIGPNGVGKSMLVQKVVYQAPLLN